MTQKIVDNWLSLAEYDLATADAMLQTGRLLYVGFMCQQAIEKITADGVVEGPRGPRPPHKKWNVGTEPGTPHETKGPDAHGPYGLPMP